MSDVGVGAQNAAFVRKLDKKVDILRVVNKWDMVPHVPGEQGYQGASTRLYTTVLIADRCAGVLHFIVAIGELWLRMTPTYRWWRFSRLVLILPW